VTGPPTPRARIVVGIDGSRASQQALRWAMRQAELTQAEVHAVMAWYPPAASGLEFAMDVIDWEAEARDRLAAALVDCLGPSAAERVQRHVVEGHPAKTLLQLAAGAELLVVGRRGRGGFVGMLLGSVSTHVMAHATCPVVVVHEDPAPGSPGRAAADAG
jgi:nucleotide-binding universal stress UspA family protein